MANLNLIHPLILFLGMTVLSGLMLWVLFRAFPSLRQHRPSKIIKHPFSDGFWSTRSGWRDITTICIALFVLEALGAIGLEGLLELWTVRTFGWLLLLGFPWLIAWEIVLETMEGGAGQGRVLLYGVGAGVLCWGLVAVLALTGQ